METVPIILRKLDHSDKATFRAAVREFSASNKEMPFAFDYNEAGNFDEYVKKLEDWTQGKNLSEGHVPHSYLVGAVDDRIIGRISIRHELNPFLERIGGHIGYAIVPSARKRGYATELLRQGLLYCRTLGLEKVLITCDLGNTGSRRVIEKNGGIFEGITNEPDLKIQKRRFWIPL